MARICVEYECEVQESQRRPANLLDALERGDHRRGEDGDAVVGEEKVACFHCFLTVKTSSALWTKEDLCIQKPSLLR